mmetsp:Transcript_47602/g.53882  ORF Transcript_47602/g.53882 Transcript_47602/m.53882 type:complete len:91 (-) Transcript_47602:259-531(-)
MYCFPLAQDIISQAIILPKLSAIGPNTGTVTCYLRQMFFCEQVLCRDRQIPTDAPAGTSEGTRDHLGRVASTALIQRIVRQESLAAVLLG